MPTEYTIYRVTAGTLVPLGVGVGSYPAAAARQFFALGDNAAEFADGDLAVIPTRSIHRLAGKTETQTRLVFK